MFNHSLYGRSLSRKHRVANTSVTSAAEVPLPITDRVAVAPRAVNVIVHRSEICAYPLSAVDGMTVTSRAVHGTVDSASLLCAKRFRARPALNLATWARCGVIITVMPSSMRALSSSLFSCARHVLISYAS